jgi:hypothetical protein
MQQGQKVQLIAWEATSIDQAQEALAKVGIGSSSTRGKRCWKFMTTFFPCINYRMKKSFQITLQFFHQVKIYIMLCISCQVHLIISWSSAFSFIHSTFKYHKCACIASQSNTFEFVTNFYCMLCWVKHIIQAQGIGSTATCCWTECWQSYWSAFSRGPHLANALTPKDSWG